MSAAGLDLGAYGRILRLPHAWPFAVAGVVARYPRAMLSLGVILLVASVTGSFAAAGFTTGALVIGMAVAAPFWSSRMDRRGQAGIILVSLGCLVGTVAALVAAVLLHAPVPVQLAAALATGASAPDFASAVRARWTALTTGADRSTAFAMETIGDQLVYITGPPLITVLAALVSPVVGIGVAVGLGIVGGLWLAALRASEPTVVLREGAGRRLVLPPPAVLPVTLACVFLGAMFGSFDVTVVGWADAAGAGWLAGIALSSLAVAIAIGSIVVGARGASSERSARARFIGFAAAAAVAASGLPLLQGTPLIFAAIGLTGLLVSPVMVSGITLAAARAPRDRVTEVLAYPTAAMSIGVPLGGVLAGAILDTHGVAPAFVVTVAAVALVSVVGAAGEGMLTAARRRTVRGGHG